ncbi:DUF1223 domain-containing protein [Cribrihabitans neustonicus]|uniref:DUF1223 domain-containing protein n=1 Tax=Cribrihabitans neustonicus TaxID=1429085 RepID=UPI003B5B7064
MRRLAALAAVLSMALPVCVRAQEAVPPVPDAPQPPVLVELFTSQGCAACPPADALLHRLAGREGVLPLALHVDYWDYIGWKDRFADPAHTKRQKGYAQAAGRRMIYTPQMIVMGIDDVMGSDAVQVAEAIARHKDAPRLVSLGLERAGESLLIRLEPRGSRLEGIAHTGREAAQLIVQLVRYAPLKTVRITRGELAGRTLSYANVVEDWQLVAEWDGRAPLDLVVPLPGPNRAAVVVQQGAYGPVLAAAAAD